MTRRFDAFVMFAEMRTGSNHLEASLDDLPDVTCYGEVYNPTFIGGHKTFDLLGFDMTRRDQDPLGLLDAILKDASGIPGFRLFHDHDDRVVDRVLPDPRIAKIILTRNPLESYVSRKIASATGQWRLKDLKHHRSAKIRFESEEFAEMLERLQAFQLRLQRGLQITGQTAFHVRYEDINDPDVLNGIAAFIGSDHRVDSATSGLKKQNPSDLEDKVENYADMVAALSRFDRFELGQTPNFEPPRHAGVPGFFAHPTAGLLFMPIKGAPEDRVLDWMGGIDGVGRNGLLSRLSQKELRQWMKAHPGYRSFTVLRHPLVRAHDVFTRFVLPTDRPNYADPRHIMQQRYNLPIPKSWPSPEYDAAAHRQAFMAFLGFLKGNLAGQTSIRIDPAWATQTAILQGIAGFTMPHRLVFENDMEDDLSRIAAEAGAPGSDASSSAPDTDNAHISLAAIYDGKLEQAAIDTYRRDYLTFGFPRWNRR